MSECCSRRDRWSLVHTNVHKLTDCEVEKKRKQKNEKKNEKHIQNCLVVGAVIYNMYILKQTFG